MEAVLANMSSFFSHSSWLCLRLWVRFSLWSKDAFKRWELAVW